MRAGTTQAWWGEPEWADRLSPREAEVVRLVAQGMSNQEIAEHLFVSLTTVKTHVAHVLLKVGARDRLQVVVEAYRSGYVSVREPQPA